MEYSNLFVVLFGIGTVFIGLICIIILITLIGYFCNLPQKKQAAEQDTQTVAAETEQKSTGKQAADGKLAAVLTAAAAAYVGADVADVKEIRIRRVGQ